MNRAFNEELGEYLAELRRVGQWTHDVTMAGMSSGVPAVFRRYLKPSVFPCRYSFCIKQCCNWSGSLIGWLVGKASKSQPVRSFDWLPAGWF